MWNVQLVGFQNLSLDGLNMAIWFFNASMPLLSDNPLGGGGCYQLQIHKCFQLFIWMKSSALVFVVVSPGSWTLVIGTRGRQHFTRSTRLNNYTLMQLFYSWKQVSIPATQTFNFIEVSRIMLPTLQHKAGHLLWKITSSCLSENYSGAHTLQVYTCQYTGVE